MKLLLGSMSQNISCFCDICVFIKVTTLLTKRGQSMVNITKNKTKKINQNKVDD